MIADADLTTLTALYPVLHSLSPRQLDLFRREAQPVQLVDQHVLFDIGCPCHSFLFLVAGSIRVTKLSATGREILLYRLKPGDSCILTVSCLLGGAAYPARGEVEREVRGFALPRPAFNQLLESSREFREFIFHFFTDRIAHLMTLVEDVAFRSLDQRVAAWLLAHETPARITHQQLAADVGSVREVISRILKDFEARGSVHLGRKLIEVVDRTALAQIAFPLSDSSH